MTSSGTNKTPHINRREFIKIGSSGALVAGSACLRNRKTPIARRRMGKTDMIASVIGMGGGSALSMIQDHEEAEAFIVHAYRQGINFFDSSPLYGGKRSSQQRFGKALKPYRKDVYLTSKCKATLTYDEVMESFEQTLIDYQTDYIDLAQVHGLQSMNEVELMFSNGVLDALVKLQEQGAVRYLGITSHNHPPALTAAIQRFDFDAVQMAMNASKAPYLFEFEERGDGSFEALTLPVAISKNMGIRAFKVTGQRRLIANGNEEGKAGALELIRYGLSLPVDGITLGMNKYQHIESVNKLVTDFKPLSRDEMAAMNERLAESASDMTLDYLRPDYEDDGMPRAHLA